MTSKGKTIMRLFICYALGAAEAERTSKLIQACTHPSYDILWFCLWAKVPGILSQQPLGHTSANSCRYKALNRDASPSDLLPSLETETNLSLQEKTKEGSGEDVMGNQGGKNKDSPLDWKLCGLCTSSWCSCQAVLAYSSHLWGW